jgi:2-succinyl-5-enolpyruvyl-6-hydroxy-3-cyclohexene-1-carboxylate synthase
MPQALSDKASVQILVQQCVAHGLKEIVISPGSRNAPLILSFNAIPEITCFTLVDERSAAFFAMGMAQQLKRPVALLCTSGTAALNYAPAIAEAYYQEIPLLVLTADRPEEWIGQADGQTIPQANLYQNFIRYQANLPVSVQDADDQWYAHRIISEAFIKTQDPVSGPVHINIPLREPLYNKSVPESFAYHAIAELKPQFVLSEEQLNLLASQWNACHSVMIICGVHQPNKQLSEAINQLSVNSNTVVLSETTSNLKGAGLVECIDRQLSGIKPANGSSYAPELLISFGGQIVSKQIKTFLRNHPPKAHWHISMNADVIDTFQHLSLAVKMKPVDFFSQMTSKISNTEYGYKKYWEKHTSQSRSIHDQYVNAVEWSDLKALSVVFRNIPASTHLQLANSTPVRYAQLFQDEIKGNTFANRGTSGIDGAVSTAVGAAWASKNKTILVSGDMSFFYDSNGLWNKYLKPDFKIVLINNGGGGIFRYIPGPSQTEELEEFFEARHQQSAKYIAKAFGLKYMHCANENELELSFSEMMGKDEQATLLEVFTPAEKNGEILRNYFKYLQSKA